MLAEGLTPTAALARLNERDRRARAGAADERRSGAHVGAHRRRGWCAFQEFMIRERAAGIIEGSSSAAPSRRAPAQQALAAIAGADAIVIGPSNPLASIAPILAVPGIREALQAATAPVVAVSPIVGGEVLKGPTAVVHGVRRAGAQRERRGRLLRRAARRDRGRRRRRPPGHAADGHAHG